jgi:FixJ family two-component response regulator
VTHVRKARADGRGAITLERAPSPSATALNLEAHGVTEREREVATLLARGLSNAQIAAALVLSPTPSRTTSAVSSRRPASGRARNSSRVFLDDCLPRIAQQRVLTSSGAFAE